MNNCQKFVDTALEVISCKKTWLEDGPIVRFLNHVTKLDCGASIMSFWDLQGQQHTFEDYDEFRLFCKQNSAIQDLFENLPSYINTDPEKAELLQVLKAIERGFQIQKQNDKKLQNKDLLFPIESYENVGAITAFPPLTTFVSIKGGDVAKNQLVKKNNDN